MPYKVKMNNHKKEIETSVYLWGGKQGVIAIPMDFLCHRDFPFKIGERVMLTLKNDTIIVTKKSYRRSETNGE